MFAREAVARRRERDELPWLVFFQGGPGFEAARPFKPSSPSWLERALEDYRVLLLDQRGTGRSTPVGTLAELSPEEQADYLKHFRADGIVRDAELIRGELGVERWSVLGQSFGGFCVTRYLSAVPEGLAEAFITAACRRSKRIRTTSIGRPTGACLLGTARTTSATRKIVSAFGVSASASTRPTCGCRRATV